MDYIYYMRLLNNIETLLRVVFIINILSTVFLSWLITDYSFNMEWFLESNQRKLWLTTTILLWGVIVIGGVFIPDREIREYTILKELKRSDPETYKDYIETFKKRGDKNEESNSN